MLGRMNRAKQRDECWSPQQRCGCQSVKYMRKKKSLQSQAREQLPEVLVRRVQDLGLPSAWH